MKALIFVIGFWVVVVFFVPRITATDPEPIGAKISLYLLSFLFSIICATAFLLLRNLCQKKSNKKCVE